MDQNSVKYEFLDHPADIKIRAYGKDLSHLFINCALGMMDFLYGKPSLPTTYIERIEITADNQESLLVNWLADLLWRSDTYHRVYKTYHVEHLTPTQLIATVESAEAIAKEDIKAVTYHDLTIQPIGDRWMATVVYDI
jgi:SHS2 domain-containing protein